MYLSFYAFVFTYVCVYWCMCSCMCVYVCLYVFVSTQLTISPVLFLIFKDQRVSNCIGDGLSEQNFSEFDRFLHDWQIAYHSRAQHSGNSGKRHPSLFRFVVNLFLSQFLIVYLSADCHLRHSWLTVPRHHLSSLPVSSFHLSDCISHACRIYRITSHPVSAVCLSYACQIHCIILPPISVLSSFFAVILLFLLQPHLKSCLDIAVYTAV